MWTIGLCLIAAALGTLFGILLALAQTSHIRVLRWCGNGYVSLIRGVPLLVLVFMIYFGVPIMFPAIGSTSLSSAIIALTVYAAAYLAEIFRGSLAAVPTGQYEAAAALGFSYRDRLLSVIFPQASRIAVPPVISFFIGLIKDSSLVTVIGFIELTKAGTIISNTSGEPLLAYLIVAAFYFVICFAVSLIGRWYERRLDAGFVKNSRSRRGKAAEVS